MAERDDMGRAGASEATLAANRATAEGLAWEDRRDFEDSARGLIAELPDGGRVRGADGGLVWDLSRFEFLHSHGEEAPETVNPSLWRQMRLTVQGGLYEVVPGLYQVRTLDLSNITFAEGPDGIVAFDPLISAETARAALDLYYEHRPRKPIVAVVYSHSHVDHFGGVRGIVDEADVKAGKVKVYAPEGFLEAAIAENVLAGNVMSRRASYMYGVLLPADPRGQVGAGLGVTTSLGAVGLIAPTDIVSETGQREKIAGLDFEFMMAPDSEAPAEMHWFIEQFGAVTAAENCCHTLHNTYTLRGAKIRDPLSWSKHLERTIAMWGAKAEVMFGMHHWPAWGNERVREMLGMGRDGYRFINDETLRLANHGLGPSEIAEQVAFTPELDRHWAMRGYYGSLNHNVKATYVNYLGWFDGNPAGLHTLPPVEAAKRYVEFMGGADAVLGRARTAFEAGEYRWVAEVVNHVVFAEPDNEAAKALQADALEQLGYQSESGPWRNFYLSGASELRNGVFDLPAPSSSSADNVSAMTTQLFWDYLAMRLNGAEAGDRRITLVCELPDIEELWTLMLRHGTLSHRAGAESEADATVTIDRADLDRVILKAATLEELLGDGTARIEGDPAALHDLLGLLDDFDFWFNIVTP
jgi:alkyl sulfatase BDS1-like metallo-beta-lactamase superfamily hydrolase